MKTALILIDIQQDYFPGGKCELVGINAAAEKSRDLLSYYREKGFSVFHVQHIEDNPEAEFFAPGTPGVEIAQIVAPKAGEVVVQKSNPNSFLNTSLKLELDSKGIERVIITGNMSHMCVDATARAAIDYGYSCTVIEDSCATCDTNFKGVDIPASQVHGSFMSALKEAGAEVMELKEFLKAA